VKKTLLKLAFKEKEITAIDPKELKGELGVIFGFKDEITPAKIIYKFSQQHESLPKILGGILENNFKEEQDIVALAKLPSKEELLRKLLGSISNPISALVNILQGNIRGLVYVLGQISKNK
jgi:large subunit ribosomal protein L10